MKKKTSTKICWFCLKCLLVPFFWACDWLELIVCRVVIQLPYLLMYHKQHASSNDICDGSWLFKILNTQSVNLNSFPLNCKFLGFEILWMPQARVFLYYPSWLILCNTSSLLGWAIYFLFCYLFYIIGFFGCSLFMWKLKTGISFG